MKGFPSQAASPRSLPYYVVEEGRQAETSYERGTGKGSFMPFFLRCLARHPLLTIASVWETLNLGETSTGSSCVLTLLSSPLQSL